MVFLFGALLGSPVLADDHVAGTAANCSSDAGEMESIKRRYEEAISAYETAKKQITSQWDAQAAEVTRQTKIQSSLIERAEALSKRQAEILEDTARNQDRFAAVLERWEKQQTQIQSLINSQSNPQQQ